MDRDLIDRIRGCAVGAAAGDALGMPLEFYAARPTHDLVRNMLPGRLAAGTFTDDTEMALALAESLLAHRPLDPDDLAQRFVAWYRTHPPDIGEHTAKVLRRIAQGERWQDATAAEQRAWPASAANGTVMRCWPVALAYWSGLDALLDDSRLQSQVTHAHPECAAACQFVNAGIHFLLHGETPAAALDHALRVAQVPQALRELIEAAPQRPRDQLKNSGWVRHTVESAVWGLLTTTSFEDAVVQVANLGNDADTAASVVGALAGAAYGLGAIPADWRDALHGDWPVDGSVEWRLAQLVEMADRLAA